MMQLKTLNKKELEDFVISGDYLQFDFLPITEHRAKSHINNPKATDEQTLLILAFCDGKLAGYMGCLPDYFSVENKNISFAWLSTLYVSEEFRGKKIAKALLMKALEAYENRVIMAEFTKEAEVFFNHMGNVENIFPKSGKRYYFKVDATEMIVGKKPWTKTFSPLLQMADGVTNSLISLKNRKIKKPDFRFETLDHADAEILDFVNTFSCKRSISEINYFVENPWVMEGRKKDDNYFFSSYAEVFKYIWVKIYDHKGNLETCSLMLLRDGHLKIPYIFSKTDRNLTQLIHFLSYFIIKNKVKMMTSYNVVLNNKIEEFNMFPKIYERNFKRDYLFRHELLQELPKDFNPELQDGDGDCLMT